MKLAILTLQSSINPGAFFQVYCLQQYLRSLGHDVSVVEYYPPKNEFNQFVRAVIKKNPKKTLQYYRKYRAQQLATKTHLNLIPLEAVTDMDAVIVGSDIVWDFNNHFYGYDPTFFGNLPIDREATKLISYAASAGSQNADAFPEHVIEAIRNNFKAISVRDLNTQALVKQRVERDAQLVIDPIFLHNVPEELPSEPVDSDFIAVYGIHFHDDSFAQIRAIAAKEHLKIVAIGYYNGFADENVIGVDPFTWARYMYDAKYVVTSTFHGVLYALQMEKNFCYIDAPVTTIKLQYIMDRAGAHSRICAAGDSIERILHTPADYASIRAGLQEYIDQSKQWIQNALPQK